MGAIISKTGCYIPNFAVRNDEFLDNSFLDNDGNPFLKKIKKLLKSFLLLLVSRREDMQKKIITLLI